MPKEKLILLILILFVLLISDFNLVCSKSKTAVAIRSQRLFCVLTRILCIEVLHFLIAAHGRRLDLQCLA